MLHDDSIDNENETIYTDFLFESDEDVVATNHSACPGGEIGQKWGQYDTKPIAKINFEKAVKDDIETFFQKVSRDKTGRLAAGEKDGHTHV